MSQKSRRLEIAPDRYRQWLNGRTAVLAQINLAKPTLRNAVCLALWEERGRAFGYDHLFETFRKRSLFKKRISTSEKESVLPSLRLALSDLSSQLQRENSPFQVRTVRSGKQAHFMLSRFSNQNHTAADKCRVIPGAMPKAFNAAQIAAALVREGGNLPSAALYLDYRSAAKWLCYSWPLGDTKKDYEAEAFFSYEFDKHLRQKTRMGVIALGAGEGLGEIELLKRLLREPSLEHITEVHYLTVDSSELLMASHLCLVRAHFREEINSGKLIIAPVHGDFKALESQLHCAREVLGDRFLRDCPIAITYLGNTIGNDEYGEWSFFRGVMDAFPSETDIMFLVGVSVLRRKDDREKGAPEIDIYYLDSFLLETPRTLLCESGFLSSLDENGTPIPKAKNHEFLIPYHQGNILGDPVPPEPYTTPLGIHGLVYRHRYVLKHDLALSTLPVIAKKGTRITLSSVIKYDLKSFCQALSERGLVVRLPSGSYPILRQVNGPEEYRYAVLGITTARRETL